MPAAEQPTVPANLLFLSLKIHESTARRLACRELGPTKKQLNPVCSQQKNTCYEHENLSFPNYDVIGSRGLLCYGHDDHPAN